MAKTTTILGAALVIAFLVGIFAWHSPHSPAQGPHGVTLSWQPPPAKQGIVVIGYNVYRRPDDSPSFVRIAERVQSPYEDSLVTSGRTYLYAVTSVEESGRESRYSTVTRATVP